MQNFNTLKSKIVLLLMTSIALVLVLIAFVSSFLITELHQTTAEEKLLNSIVLLQQSLGEKQAKLIESGQRLQSNEAVLASTHLIWDYQDPDNYQPLIFDVEKKDLVNLLELEAQGTGYAFVGIYSLKGEWLSFYDAKKNIKAYGSYNKQGQAVIKTGGTEINSSNHKFPVTPSRDGTDSRQGAYYRLSNNGKDLILMAHFPIMTPDKQTPKVMAWLYLAYVLDEGFAETVSVKTGSNLLIYDLSESESQNYVLVGEGHNPVFSKQITKVVSEVSHAMYVKNNHDAETHFMHADDYFAVMFPLRLENEKDLYVAFGLDKANLSSSIATFKRAIFVVLLLSGIIVVPMGVWFACRTVIDPVHRLTELAKSLASGKTPNIYGFSSKDELGVLADAFNTMTVAIHMREESLRSKQREIEGIIENAPSVISMKTADGKYVMVNHLFTELFKLSSDDIIGRTDMEIFPDKTAKEFAANDLKVAQNKIAIQFEESILQGEILHTYISNKFPLLDNNKNVIAVCSIATDITERKNAENKLSLAKSIIDHANEAVVVTDLDALIEEVNDAYVKISGYSRDEVIGVNPKLLQSGHHDKEFYKAMWKSIIDTGCWEGEMWDRRKNGEVYPQNLSISTVYDDEGQAFKYVGIFSDITERKETEKELKHLAYNDALTGLPNRVMFYDRLQQAISAAKRDDHLLAIMMVDLDRFKHVNDTLGHDAGDELLVIVAQRLTSLVREADTVARIGGDEFRIILSDIKNADEASIVAQKIIDNLRLPIQVKGKMVNIGASIGIAVYPTDDVEIEQLIKFSDMALYKAKESGRNCYLYFSSDLQTQVLDNIEMESDMQKAIALNEFTLHYQPKINLYDGSLSGMESLIRWHHPEKGLIPPDQFIPFAEETGLIIPLGEWILNTACQQLRLWSENLQQPLNLAINLSALQFQQKDFVHTMKKIIDTHGINPQYLELEITESMVMADVDKAIDIMKQLRELGLKLAIDDFGTGYSSLNYLKRFPINTLKIDRSFVRELTIDSKDAAMVKAIISMAKDLDLEVVAEGVETKEQLDFLRMHDCQYVQGFYFSKPLNVEEFDAYIEKHIK